MLVFVQLKRLVEPLNALLVLLLVQQQLSAIRYKHEMGMSPRYALVIAWLSSDRELLENPPERRHAWSNISLLILRDRLLDMGKDEASIERC